jgi:hypothetical protein
MSEVITSRITKIRYKPTLLQRIFGISESEEHDVLCLEIERSGHGFYEIPNLRPSGPRQEDDVQGVQ